jgi:hypothetical protein
MAVNMGGGDVAAVDEAVVRLSRRVVATMTWQGLVGGDVAVVVCGGVNELTPGWPKRGC